MTFGVRVSLLLSSGALVAAVWKFWDQPPACGCPGPFVPFSALLYLLSPTLTLLWMEMDGFLLTVPSVCPPVMQAQALALQELKAGAQQLEMRSDLFNGDVRDGSRQLWILLLICFPSLPSLSFSLSLPPPLFQFYFNSTTNCSVNLS